MAEKRVSVRLAAVGGRQVRAELEGIGEAGSRGFGRLSHEMEAANARMAAFSRRVAVAAAAVAAAMAAGVSGPLKEALKSGELSWQSFAQALSGIAQNLANRLIDSAFKPIEDALFRAFSGGGGSGGGIFGWIGKATGGLFGGGRFAKGGAFGSTGEITAFASGGVVSQPTVFPFARGIGLMGEAGPEAILPLRRGRGGRLGVEAGGTQSVPQITPRIINVLDPSLAGDYLATPAGERAIVNVIRLRIVEDAFALGETALAFRLFRHAGAGEGVCWEVLALKLAGNVGPARKA